MFFLKSSTHLSSLVSSLLSSPQGDITLVTPSLTLTAHRALLLPHLPALAALLCPSCSPHDPLLLLLPQTPAPALTSALEQLYRAGEVAPLAALLGLDSGQGGGGEGREGRREELSKGGDDTTGMEERQKMEDQEAVKCIEEQEKANKEDDRRGLQEQKTTVIVEQEIGEGDMVQGEEKEEMVRLDGKELGFQDPKGEEARKDGRVYSDQSIEQEITSVKTEENYDSFLEGFFDSKTYLADNCQDRLKNHNSVYNQDCDKALAILKTTEKQICKKFQCSVCQQTYESSYVLKAHKVTCHGADDDIRLSKSLDDLDFTDYIDPSKQHQTLSASKRSKIQRKIEDLPDWVKLLHKTKNPGHSIEFLVSNYGGPQLLVDSYIFITDIPPKQKTEGLHLYWKCNNKKCFLRLQTLDGKIKRKAQPNARRTHNHDAPIDSVFFLKDSLRKKEWKLQLSKEEYTLTGSKRKRKRRVGTSLPEWHQQALKIENPTHWIDFVPSGKGGTLLSLDQYLFTINKIYQQTLNGVVTYWVCSDLQCNASVTTVNGRIEKSKAHMGAAETESAAVNLHNHEEPVDRIAKLKGREAFRAAVINSPEEHISDIVKQFSQGEMVKGKDLKRRIDSALTYKTRYMSEQNRNFHENKN